MDVEADLMAHTVGFQTDTSLLVVQTACCRVKMVIPRELHGSVTVCPDCGKLSGLYDQMTYRHVRDSIEDQQRQQKRMQQEPDTDDSHAFIQRYTSDG